ncbi:protein crooked neck [Paraphysoderma sedebokerense]|nr:protein crooked neck [Paraphysoderma sedebokerense]
MDKRLRPAKVKNKNAADIQITAEQILREAAERQEPVNKLPRQKVTDAEELNEYKLSKRKGFEDAIRRNNTKVGQWLKYAAWEESLGELARARSIYERALAVDMRNPALWIRYAEMEMKNKNVNLARNLWDRAVTLLPRVDQFWYKYAYMEEMLGNVPGARQIFERWMQWEPNEEAWEAYIKLEKRYNELDRARAIYERFVTVHPDPKNWIKFAKFEEELNELERCRSVYEHAVEYLGEEHIRPKLLGAFAKFEIRLKEYERARAIYKFALERLPKSQTEHIYKMYTQFEKQYGQKEGIEDVILAKRRWQYEEEIKTNPDNYDTWFDYARLEESNGDPDRIREIYERAIAQVPPAEEKRLWRRYIYLWIYYALYEEIEARDPERTRQVYTQCLNIIPHKVFTFAKVWLLYAQFEIRQMNLSQARKTLGYALGICPKEKLFKGYIEMELMLREFDRVRTLYEKYLTFNPANCYAWIKYAELERMLDDIERCRGIFELAIQQDVLDMPEVLWKAYIDFEFEEQEYARTRDLYERLLQRTEHVKVWISYAKFEIAAMDVESEQKRIENARGLFERGYKRLKEREAKEERVLLLEAWKDFETAHGTPQSLQTVQSKIPRLVKKRRKVEDETGAGTVQWEEYYDYIFPDDEKQKPNFKLLALAHQWKMKMEKEGKKEEPEEEDKDEDEEQGNEESRDEDENDRSESDQEGSDHGDSTANGSNENDADDMAEDQ